MKHFDSTVTRLVVFQNSTNQIVVTISRSSANIYTLLMTLCDIKNAYIKSHTSTHTTPITMRILENHVSEMIDNSGGLLEGDFGALVQFREQFGRTNPRKRISKQLKLFTGGLMYQYENQNWYSRYKGNVVIELAKKVYVDLEQSVDEQDNNKVFLKLHIVVDKLGDYSFVLEYRLLVGEEYVPGRVILKEKVKDNDDFVSLVRKGLLVAKQRGKLSIHEVEAFYKEVTSFVMNNEFAIEEIIDRLNARLPI
ncbi:hypothetical protein PQC65_gp161 [Aeromonas phage pAEv1810]|uniref:hypothetical protein n=1 Tax=Aeromonas phage pAEv1810 TaxID=2908744 RepID=UPI0023299335|nr:hypothetical protein PQC65_gp161 [Aeromonas phage pAEv1810]UIS25099.1 hypothetical protein pAEv1810_161 [Aeromonas phage pAEv1810]